MESAGSSQSRFSFQHFNPEYDIGIVNEHGERVRKRKRPGRKSNPPSVEERREQNRVAQKIFREKEQRRREKQEQERRQLSNEIFRLRKKLAEVEYEANYLRGYALQLSLACLLHRGSVPYIWSERCFYDRHTTPVFTQSTRPEMKSFAELYQVPRLFEMILGENQQILDFDNALAAIDYTRRESSATSFLKCIPPDEFILNTKRQEPVCVFPKRTDEDQSNDDFVEASIEDDNSSSSETAVDTERIKDSNIPSENNSLISFQKPVRGVIHETPTLKTTDDLTDIPAMQALHVVRLQLKMSSILGTTTPAVLLPSKCPFSCSFFFGIKP
jgi:hypothetical protein